MVPAAVRVVTADGVNRETIKYYTVPCCVEIILLDVLGGGLQCILQDYSVLSYDIQGQNPQSGKNWFV